METLETLVQGVMAAARAVPQEAPAVWAAVAALVQQTMAQGVARVVYTV
jgi:hypothetical protein